MVRQSTHNVVKWIAAIILVLGAGGAMVLPEGTGQGPQNSVRGKAVEAATISDKIEVERKVHDLFALKEDANQPAKKVLTVNASLVIKPEDNTPYLSKQITNREIWQIEVASVRLELPSARDGRLVDKTERTFDVFLDSDGRLLKIESRWPDGEPPIPPEPDAESTTDQFWRSGKEVYHAFPDGPPAISFLEALDGLAEDIGNVLMAKQIKAQYVLWSKLDWEPRPMWIISLRGIPPFHASRAEVSVHARDHLRFIVDPKTGHWVQALSTPQPDIDWSGRQAFAGGIPAGTVELYLDSPADGQNVNAGDVITWQIEAAVSVLARISHHSDDL